MNDDTMKKNIYSIGMWLITIVGCFIIAFVLWSMGMYASYWYAKKHFIVGGNDNASALFGDSAGAVNAFISALAFVGVIIAIFMQRNELKLQRDDLALQREEMQKNTEELGLQREQFEVQNKTIKLQRFENTFFNMLSLQQEIVNNIKHSYIKETKNMLGGIMNSESVETSGRQVFEHLYVIDLKPIIEENRGYVFNSINFDLFDHYFLHIYRIIKFVDETILLDNKIEKYSYISILRATLSRYELVYLFYNELNPIFSHFKELIEEYSLFDNINFASLIQPRDKALEDIKRYYKDSAYDPSIKGYNTPPQN